MTRSQEQVMYQKLSLMFVIVVSEKKKLYVIKYTPHCEKPLSKDPFNKDLHIN